MPRKTRAGYTLMETMVAAAIGSMVLAAVMTTYVFSVKSFRAISNYVEIHSDGRHAIDFFARDVRAVSAIQSFATNSVVLTIPTAFSGSGTVISNKTVTYTFNSGKLYRTDSTLSGTKELAANIKALNMALYDKVGNPTTVLSTAKGIQIELELEKQVISQVQSEDYLSARLDMRNKP
jgi:prepilin-type N-terminal cleavage/methylation domain-containing protein